jgi:hypothetical protein
VEGLAEHVRPPPSGLRSPGVIAFDALVTPPSTTRAASLTSNAAEARQQPPGHFIEAHNVLLWPAVQSTLTTVDKHHEVDFHTMFRQPTAWFVQREIQRYPYPLSCRSHASGTTELSSRKILCSENSGVEWTLGLSRGVIQQLVDDYFSSFNINWTGMISYRTRYLIVCTGIRRRPYGLDHCASSPRLGDSCS